MLDLKVGLLKVLLLPAGTAITIPAVLEMKARPGQRLFPCLWPLLRNITQMIEMSVTSFSLPPHITSKQCPLSYSFFHQGNHIIVCSSLVSKLPRLHCSSILFHLAKCNIFTKFSQWFAVWSWMLANTQA